MIAVIFEVIPNSLGRAEYLSIAADLRKYLNDIPGFISIERFQSLSDERKILSLSFLEDESAVEQWRNLETHRIAQLKGRNALFDDYRIRVGSIVRDYSLTNREQVPEDSKSIHR